MKTIGSRVWRTMTAIVAACVLCTSLSLTIADLSFIDVKDHLAEGSSVMYVDTEGWEGPYAVIDRSSPNQITISRNGIPTTVDLCRVEPEDHWKNRQTKGAF